MGQQSLIAYNKPEPEGFDIHFVQTCFRENIDDGGSQHEIKKFIILKINIEKSKKLIYNPNVNVFTKR